MSELIVVTLIVAAEGGVKVPKVTSREDLTKALNKLGALRSDQVQPACSHLYIHMNFDAKVAASEETREHFDKSACD